MEAYRAAVREAIERLDGYHALDMEHFGARDAASYDACMAKVAEGTFFVGIVGHEYGSVHPVLGRSYSELEYEEAVQRNIRRLMFVAPDDFPVQAHLIEPDTIRERQVTFRKRVLSDRQVAFFSTEDELGRLVTEAIHNCENQIASQVANSTTTRVRTRLLYPYVTNIQGFDTGIVISNVSRAPDEITPVRGAALFNFFGSNAPPVSSTSEIAPGEVFTTLASMVSPGFNGYLYVYCQFHPARGYAFITDVGARNLATGYLAEAVELRN